MTTKEESEKWLNNFIRQHAHHWMWSMKHKEYGAIDCNSISELIPIIEEYLKEGKAIDGWCFDNDEVDEGDFKHHYENYTGKKIGPDKDVSFIQCCC